MHCVDAVLISKGYLFRLVIELDKFSYPHKQNLPSTKSVGHNNQWLPVISYPGHFVPTLVISYLFFGHFAPSNNHFVPRSFRTHFGHFVPRSTGYEMTIWWSIRTQVISYPFWSFRTHFCHFVPSKDGWIDERTDRRVLIEMTN